MPALDGRTSSILVSVAKQHAETSVFSEHLMTNWDPNSGFFRYFKSNYGNKNLLIFILAQIININIYMFM